MTRYKYDVTTVGEDGNMVTNTVESDFEQLKEQYWQQWADMRTAMQMPVEEDAFISDLRVIINLKRVHKGESHVVGNIAGGSDENS